MRFNKPERERFGVFATNAYSLRLKHIGLSTQTISYFRASGIAIWTITIVDGSS